MNRPTRIALPVVALVAMLLGVVVACDSGPGADRQIATGVVVDVDATGLDRVDSFTIRTSEGAVRSFGVGALDPGSFPPGHLTEHAATAQPIVVTYVVADDGAEVAVKLEDAPTDASPSP
jgi:hypothetical protein